MKLRAIAFPLIAISITFADPCSRTNIPDQKPHSGEHVFEVKVIKPTFKTVPREYKIQGQFEASETAKITANATGQVSQILVNEGDKVKQDDPVVILSSTHLNDKIDILRSKIKELEARLKAAQADLKNLGAEDRPVSDQEVTFLDEDNFDTSQQSNTKQDQIDLAKKPTTLRELVGVLDAMIKRFTKEADLLDKTLLELTHKSPITGIVTKKLVTEKNMVVQGHTLIEITKTDPMSIVFELPQKVASFVSKKSIVRFVLADSHQISGEGQVYYISPNLKPLTQTVEIKAHIPNDKDLIKGGQKGTVNIATTRMEQAIVIPEKALLREGQKAYIFVLQGNQAKKTEVEVGRKLDADQIQVVADISVDHQVIVSLPEGLKHNSFVRPFAIEENKN